jgi:hypothetical protein
MMLDKLDEQLAAGIKGDFETGQRLCDELEQERPNCNRAAFNRGWYEMMKGNLLKGHQCLDRGRNESVFGNTHTMPKSNRPLWNGERGVTVMMRMEGGLGDQIHAIRYAKDIADYGNKVVIDGCEYLADLMINVEGVSALCQHEAAMGVYHDYWVPSMSAVVPLKLEYPDLSGEPYIRRTGQSEGKIGVKWSGNPMFEHQQHRLFDHKLMFDMLENHDCISLQKYDKEIDGLVEAPFWMEQQPLDSWSQTRAQISRCDLVITSCTSVAHLAGAMGVKTWIVVPILPYYLWALPGNKTPYYDSVTLFRQEEYGNWEAPFKAMTEQLQLQLQQKVAA